MGRSHIAAAAISRRRLGARLIRKILITDLARRRRHILHSLKPDLVQYRRLSVVDLRLIPAYDLRLGGEYRQRHRGNSRLVIHCRIRIRRKADIYLISTGIHPGLADLTFRQECPA